MIDLSRVHALCVWRRGEACDWIAYGEGRAELGRGTVPGPFPLNAGRKRIRTLIVAALRLPPTPVFKNQIHVYPWARR